MISIKEGKNKVLSLMKELKINEEIKITNFLWQNNKVFNNVSTPIFQFTKETGEVVEICITYRKLEKLDDFDMVNHIKEMILNCF